MMADLYIATSTQAGHDALMRLAESAGYKWHDDDLPTVCHLCDYVEEEENVVHLYDDFQDGRRMAQDDRAYYESQGVTIETIPNLADIKAIYRFENEESFNLFRETHDKHLSVTNHKNSFAIEYSDGIVLFDYESMYETLAVEYKLQESEVMPEKVKLPKFMCDWLKQNEGILYGCPMADVSTLARERDTVVDVETWLFRNTTNQWKLIDALRYGYEAEPEPRWGIKAGNCYMDAPDSWGFDNVTPKVVIDNDAYWTIKKAADEIVRVLGFGEVVDLNKEGKADD